MTSEDKVWLEAHGWVRGVRNDWAHPQTRVFITELSDDRYLAHSFFAHGGGKGLGNTPEDALQDLRKGAKKTVKDTDCLGLDGGTV